VRIIAWVALCVLGVTANGVSAQQPIRVAYAPFSAPIASLPGATPDNYSSLDPRGTMAQGAMIDVMEWVARAVGRQIRFVAVPGSKQLAALKANEIDLAMTSIAEDEAVTFTDPVFTDSEALLVKKGDGKHYATWKDLKGAKIVTIKGTPFANAAQQSGFFKEIRLVATGAEVAEGVKDPQIKAGFKGSVIDTLYAQQHGVYEPDVRMDMTYQPQFFSKFGVGALKGNALLGEVNAQLGKLKRDGTLKAIFTRYGLEGALAQENNAYCPRVGFTVVEPHATPETRPLRVGRNQIIFVRRESITATSDVVEIKLVPDGEDDASLVLKFTAPATQRLRDATTNHSGRRIAFMFDDEVLNNVVWEGPYGLDADGAQVSIRHGLNEARKLIQAIQGCTAVSVGDRTP
jgi:ABC-type amino acid transport substrate-binding protein